MKNLLLIGDSIRMGYEKSVKKTLEGRANVICANDSARFAAYLLRIVHECFEGVRCNDIDVVHWNAGLWDCLRLFGEEPHTPIDLYAYYIDRVCQRIQKVFPRAKVIFATSTRVLSEKMDKDFMRSNEDIIRYNAVAVEIVKRYGFEVDDLYTVSAALPDEAHSDPTHYYTPMGTEVLTNAVLSAVLPALDITEPLTYHEDMYTDKPHGI